jgi:hypothetical protein
LLAVGAGWNTFFAGCWGWNTFFAGCWGWLKIQDSYQLLTCFSTPTNQDRRRAARPRRGRATTPGGTVDAIKRARRGRGEAVRHPHDSSSRRPASGAFERAHEEEARAA